MADYYASLDWVVWRDAQAAMQYRLAKAKIRCCVATVACGIRLMEYREGFSDKFPEVASASLESAWE